jgi:hypothetical protein
MPEPESRLTDLSILGLSTSELAGLSASELTGNETAIKMLLIIIESSPTTTIGSNENNYA